MRKLEVAWVPVRGTWVRHTAPGVGGIEPHAGGSRWLARGRRDVYLADREATAWAELYRALAESGRGPAGAMPRDLHSVTVDLDRVADLRAERSRRVLELPRMRTAERQWPAFQAVGEQLADAGAQGALYSSAARTRALCLCVFEAGLDGISVEREPVRVIVPPRVPRGLRT